MACPRKELPVMKEWCDACEDGDGGCPRCEDDHKEGVCERWDTLCCECMADMIAHRVGGWKEYMMEVIEDKNGSYDTLKEHWIESAEPAFVAMYYSYMEKKNAREAKHKASQKAEINKLKAELAEAKASSAPVSSRQFI